MFTYLFCVMSSIRKIYLKYKIKKLTRIVTTRVSQWPEKFVCETTQQFYINLCNESQYFFTFFENGLFLIIGNLYILLYSNSKTFLLMNDLYLFGGGVYGFQNVMDPILESELKKCKTQQERDEVMIAYRTTLLFGLICAIVLGSVLCGVVALFIK